MSEARHPRALRAPAGLCTACRHAELLVSRRSTFLRCRRSFAEPEYARYPALPVTSCAGFEPVERPPPADSGGVR